MNTQALRDLVVTNCGAAGLRCNRPMPVDQQHHLGIVSILQEITLRLDELGRRVGRLETLAPENPAGTAVRDGIEVDPVPGTMATQAEVVPPELLCELIERIDCAEKEIRQAEEESEKLPDDDDLVSELGEPLTSEETKLLGEWSLNGGSCEECAKRLKHLKKLGKDTSGDAAICQFHLNMLNTKAKREKRLEAQKKILVNVTKPKYDIILKSKREMEALKGQLDITGLEPETQARIIKAHKDGKFNLNVTLVLHGKDATA